MMKFKWSVNKAIDYLCVKQPCFYLVPQFLKVLNLLEDMLKLKYPEELSNQWDYSKVSTKDEMLITNTYINTRIFPNEEIKKEEGIDSNTYRKEIEGKMPKNNRNVNQKSSTFNSDSVVPKPTTKIRWRDQVENNKPIQDLIAGVETSSEKIPKVLGNIYS